MTFATHKCRINPRRFGLAFALSLFSLLAGCSPSITCTQDVDGGELLKSLSNPTTPLETISKNVVQLLSVCTPRKEQLVAITKAVEQIASMGSASLQAAFYSQLSDSAPKSEARLNFISRSTLISGNAKVTEENFKLVELEQLGKEFDVTSASPTLAKVLEEILPNNTEAAFVRIVETDAGSIVLTRSTSSYGFSEISKLRIFNAGTGKRIATPKEEFDYLLNQSSDEPLLDYFFGCASYAGAPCGTRDTRFAIDQSGKLRFIASVLYSDIENGKCAVNLVTLRVDGQTIQAAPLLAEGRELDCSDPPSPNSHGEPFKVFSEPELLTKLVKLGNHPDVSNLVSFKNKDTADTLLKAKLWAEGPFWRGILLDKAVRKIDSKSFLSLKSDATAFKPFAIEIHRIADNVGNLNWLSSNLNLNEEQRSQLEKLSPKIESLKKRLKDIESVAVPQPVEESRYQYRRLNIVLHNQIPPQIPPEVVSLAPQQTPFAHFGVILPSGTSAILYSTIPLVLNPTQFNSLVTRSLGSRKYFINGFPQDLPFFQTLSDSEQVEYDNYLEQKKYYQQKMAAYKKYESLLPTKVNELGSEILKLDAEVSRVADTF